MWYLQPLSGSGDDDLPLLNAFNSAILVNR
jgi:hypothetical protein